MSAAYIGSVLELLPGVCVAVVLDHFPVVKLMNDRITEVWRRLHGDLQIKMGKRVFKGCLWILLKNPEHLSPDRQGCERACNCKSCWGPIKRWPKAAACGSSRAKIRPGLRWVVVKIPVHKRSPGAPYRGHQKYVQDRTLDRTTVSQIFDLLGGPVTEVSCG